MIVAAAYIKPDAPIDLGRLLDKFLSQHGITKQEAAYYLGQRPEAISRAIQGTGAMDLWAFSRWPVSLLADFLRRVLVERVNAETESVVKGGSD